MQRDEHRLMLNNFFTLSLIAVCLLVAIINWFNYWHRYWYASYERNYGTSRWKRNYGTSS